MKPFTVKITLPGKNLVVDGDPELNRLILMCGRVRVLCWWGEKRDRCMHGRKRVPEYTLPGNVDTAILAAFLNGVNAIKLRKLPLPKPENAA